MQLPSEAGVMVLNTVLFPHGILPLHIFEPRYRAMLESALQSERMFVVARQDPGNPNEAPCRIAGLGMIRYSRQRPDGTSDLVLQGVARVRLGRTVHLQPYRRLKIDPLEPNDSNQSSTPGLVLRCLELIETHVQQGFQVPGDWLKKLHATADKTQPGAEGELPPAGLFADFVACLFLRQRPDALQVLLETVEIELRLQRLIQFLTHPQTSA